MYPGLSELEIKDGTHAKTSQADLKRANKATNELNWAEGNWPAFGAGGDHTSSSECLTPVDCVFLTYLLSKCKT